MKGGKMEINKEKVKTKEEIRTELGSGMNNYKEKLFEELWFKYWWKKRSFGYRCSKSESMEMEVISTALESLLEVQRRRELTLLEEIENDIRPLSTTSKLG